MKTHCVYKSIRVSIFIVLAAARCHGSVTAGDDASGLWVMEDTPKMAKFLGLKDSPKGYYCLEFKPQEGKAKVKFLYSKPSYPLQVQSTGPNRYRVFHGKDMRDVFISSDTSASTGEIGWSWHFSDSSPYNPHDVGIYDGSKEPENESLGQCIKNVQQDYEFAIQEHPEQ